MSSIYIQRIYSSSVSKLLINDVLLTKSNGEKYQTDKCNIFYNYLNKYEFFFKELKEEPIHVLELGVYNGSSLQTWENYFTKAQIYGVDVEKNVWNTQEADVM